MPAPIDFYFEFASPYGYLASTQIEALGARHGREVVWHPIMLGAAFKETGARPLTQTPLKGPYLRHDVPRFARLLGVPFREPPVMPANSLAASRAFVWLEPDDPELAKRLAQAVFHAHWGEGRDIGAPEQVAEIAAPLGIERSALLAAAGRSRRSRTASSRRPRPRSSAACSARPSSSSMASRSGAPIAWLRSTPGSPAAAGRRFPGHDRAPAADSTGARTAASGSRSIAQQIHNAFDDRLIAELTAELTRLARRSGRTRGRADRQRQELFGRRRPQLDAPDRELWRGREPGRRQSAWRSSWRP